MMKKIISILLTMAMCFSMLTPYVSSKALTEKEAQSILEAILNKKNEDESQEKTGVEEETEATESEEDFKETETADTEKSEDTAELFSDGAIINWLDADHHVSNPLYYGQNTVSKELVVVNDPLDQKGKVGLGRLAANERGAHIKDPWRTRAGRR